MTVFWRVLFGPMAALAALGVVAIPVTAQGPSATALMAEANARYDREEYAEAVQQYESLVDDGYHNAALYYNLGNAYLGSGDIGRAMLSYLRAEELAPRDSDIRLNLEFARDMTVDGLGFERATLIESISYGARLWVTPSELGVASLPLWVLTALSISALLIWRSFRLRAVLRVASVAGLVVTLASFLLLMGMLSANPYRDTGVVVVDAVEVVGGPGPQFPDEFIIHSGAQVRLVDSRHGWVRVSLPGGELQGWVPAYAVEAVGRGAGS